MVDWDAGPTLADRFRAHAGEHQHLYAHAMRGMADDWEAGGPVRAVCAGYEDAPRGSALPLRLLAGVFRLVLTGRAAPLKPYYPCLGGTEPAVDAWPVMRSVIAEHVPELQEAMAVVPQTNEVGRSAALLVGLFDLVSATGVRRVRLLELGASAGLNLLVDHVRFTGDGWSWGPADSPVQLLDAVTGPVVPEAFAIVQRAGCDPSPVDPTTAEGQLLLTSFVWPFDLHRHQRLAGAVRVAEQQPVRVDRAMARTWLPRSLAEPTAEDVLTVVWNSITQLYWPAEELAAVAAALDEHGSGHRLARVSMEYDHQESPAGCSGDGGKPLVRTELWRPGEEVRRRVLGTAHDHGVPVRLWAEPSG